MRRRPLVLALLGLAAIALAVAWVRLELPPFSVGTAAPDRADRLPAGRWHRAPDFLARVAAAAGGTEGDRTSAEERARLISLPYSAGGVRAEEGGTDGVVFLDRGRAEPGVNLYTSGHAPEVFLIDLEGRTLHRWRYPFERAFPGRSPTVETPFFRRAQLTPDGRLVALYQTGGLIVLDRRSHLLAAYPGGFYNDFFVEPGGRIWTISKEAREVDGGGLVGKPEYVLEDFLVVLEPVDTTRGGPAAPPGAEGARQGRQAQSSDTRQGRQAPSERAFHEVHRISLLDAFAGTPFEPLIAERRRTGDVFHTNTVEVFDGSLADRSPLYAAGNVLVSLREIDTVAILDPARGKVVWARRGPWSHQHQPTLLPSGRLLLFDNRGFHGFSRVVEVDPAGGDLVPVWAGDPPSAFFSEQAGSCQRLANGDTLITESERARAFEVTPEGEVVWEFRSPHRSGVHDELVATLFEVIRYPEGYFQPDD